MKRAQTKLVQFLSSTSFYVIALVSFSINALWLAFTAIYPLPFDEYYHFGIIKIYAAQWSPFITNQPVEASLYGDITRMPSYLYHYLMSFPYRLLDLFLDNEVTIIITLRIINILFVVIGLILFRKLFLKFGVSKIITHTVLAGLMITPILPFLAAHINYDNLMFMISPLIFSYAYYAANSRKEVKLLSITAFTLLGLITVLVKNNFLPIFAVLVIYVLVHLLKNFKINSLAAQLKNAFNKLPSLTKWIIISACIIVSCLFIERYGYNLVKYRSLWPQCQQVQSEALCSNYMPWYRNKQYKISPPKEVLYGNPISFGQHWVSKIMRGYFAIFAHNPTTVLSLHEPFGPIVIRPLLPVPIALAYLFLMTGIASLMLTFRKLWQNKFTKFALIISTSYLIILWAFNYRGYLNLGSAQAIQARYTLPVLPLLLIVFAKSLSLVLTSQKIKLLIFIIFGSLYLYSGGVAGWIIRSDPLWYWQNPTARNLNQKIQFVLKKVVWH